MEEKQQPHFPQFQINQITLSFKYFETRQSQCNTHAMAALSSLGTQTDDISSMLQTVREFHMEVNRAMGIPHKAVGGIAKNNRIPKNHHE